MICYHVFDEKKKKNQSLFSVCILYLVCSLHFVLTHCFMACLCLIFRYLRYATYFDACKGAVNFNNRDGMLPGWRSCPDPQCFKIKFTAYLLISESIDHFIWNLSLCRRETRKSMNRKTHKVEICVILCNFQWIPANIKSIVRVIHLIDF